MPNKITFGASVLASAATAFGLGALAFTSPNAPETAYPLPTHSAPDVEPETAPLSVGATEDPGTVPTIAPVACTAPSSTPKTGRHSKPRTEPETDDTATLPRHAKPLATPSPSSTTPAGSKGPLTDAEDDGKVLDDLGADLPLPDVGISIPDVMLPFPGHNHEADAETPLIAEGGSPEYPYEEAWGDTPETAADPGVVCDKELAEALGVPYSPTCYTGHSPADTWAREEAEADDQPAGPVWDLSGGNGWF
ncbi:gp23 [Lomovskayavirus C31]|uniref:Gp23 n=1 Tax=Streptomyces phage phiC31 TaxID=10719 RepID=Q9ZX85_BPPHC|nr:gp23 [Lomovskayavirus C31]CAA07147.2 gp23 [Lomovskayavirus C31]